MRVRGVQTTRYFSGFCNQLNHMIHGVIRCISENIDVMVVNDFKLEIHSDEICPIGDVVDMRKWNEYLRSEYGLTVVSEREFSVLVNTAYYGTMDNMMDVRAPFDAHFRRGDKYLVDPSFHLNQLSHDPVPGTEKSLRVVYNVGSYQVSKIYPAENIHLDFACTREGLSWILYESLAESRVWHENLMQRLPLHPRFYEEARSWAERMPNPVHVLHLRMEDDAILHWSKQNKMAPDMFRGTLASKYIDVLTTHNGVRKGSVLVLSYNEDNAVLDWLESQNIPYVQLEKDRTKGREWNAARDLVIAEMLGNGILIGALDYYRMQGSTFTHYLMQRMKAMYTVLIDIERIREKPVIF